jgi:hypothetical protein
MLFILIKPRQSLEEKANALINTFVPLYGALPIHPQVILLHLRQPTHGIQKVVLLQAVGRVLAGIEWIDAEDWV